MAISNSGLSVNSNRFCIYLSILLSESNSIKSATTHSRDR